KLLFASHDQAKLRVAIATAATKTSYDIQLNHLGLKVQANRPYVVRFQARTDCPRSLYFGVAKAHGDWMGLGLYTQIQITSEWQNFQQEFVAAADDDNARIHFDLGESDISFELSSLSLHSLDDDQSIGQ